MFQKLKLYEKRNYDCKKIACPKEVPNMFSLNKDFNKVDGDCACPKVSVVNVKKIKNAKK